MTDGSSHRHADDRSPPQPARWGWRRMIILMVIAVSTGGLAAIVLEEMRSSRLQARLLSQFARDLTYDVQEGPATSLRFPSFGPYDERLGYASLPAFLQNLSENNFTVEMQAQMSPRLEQFVTSGGFAMYREKARAGLTVLDRNSALLYANRYPERIYNRFEDVPSLVTSTLLFIENRDLLDPTQPHRNPAVDWGRFTSALVSLPAQWINPNLRIAGGSTLATQIEKFRHSPDGQTAKAMEKLRQMFSASVRAYLDGEDTTETRRRLLVDYLNSTPLTARAGFGEVHGLGDGLWAWFGSDLNRISRVLMEPVEDPKALQLKALAYKQVLALLLAQRRPSYYLITNRRALDRLADSHLRLLADAGIIDSALRDAALSLPLRFRSEAPENGTGMSFVEQKAPNAIRNRLLALLGVGSLYQLDRLDLTVQATLDLATQQRVIDVLRRLGDPAFAHALGLDGERLLQKGDPAKVIYSLTLFERGADANYVRVQADNLDQPLDINEMAKLDLGSTAKLRTLITYLETISLLHQRYAPMERKELLAAAEEAGDPLSKWVARQLASSSDHSLQGLLEAAMERRYSGNPGETFFTGGGAHNFDNFDDRYNHMQVTVTEALRHSVNLPFIRIMRDIVQFHIAEGIDDTSDLLHKHDHPLRHEYLARFADREGSGFINRYYRIYRGLERDEMLARLASRVRPVPHRLAMAFRAVRPEADLAAFSAFLSRRLPHMRLPSEELSRLYTQYEPGRYTLGDQGYLIGLHPLEVWLVTYLHRTPEASREQTLADSLASRQESYAWLFRRGAGAQNTRIRIALEEEAFARILAAWKRLGYPFDTLVPSLATAIGSSADRPAALADLMGIIVNDGIRLPTVRINRLHFAAGTPFETLVGLGPQPAERVLAPEIAHTVRRALTDVVENGTAKRVRGAFYDRDGVPIPVGGKTGTGDHRFERHNASGALIESRAVNRTATFVFFIGEHFFGTVTAFVHGPEADRYRFTSALPAQLLKSLAPALLPMMNGEDIRTAQTPPLPDSSP